MDTKIRIDRSRGKIGFCFPDEERSDNFSFFPPRSIPRNNTSLYIFSFLKAHIPASHYPLTHNKLSHFVFHAFQPTPLEWESIREISVLYYILICQKIWKDIIRKSDEPAEMERKASECYIIRLLMPAFFKE